MKHYDVLIATPGAMLEAQYVKSLVETLNLNVMNSSGHNTPYPKKLVVFNLFYSIILQLLISRTSWCLVRK
jgi:hypothetical protein